MINVKDTVCWTMGGEDKVLKVKKGEVTYDISETVHAFLESKGLYDKLDDKEVTLEIDETQGEHGTITKLVVGAGTKEEAPKETSKNKTDSQNTVAPDVNLTVKELTVGGVSVPKKSVIFKEEDKVWYTLDDSIDAQEFKNNYTKKVVEVSVETTDQGNDIIKSFTAKEETVDEAKEDEPKPSGKKTNGGNMVQKSIEAQASVNSACQIAQAILTKDSLPEDAERIITRIADYNFQKIQDLKNKE